MLCSPGTFVRGLRARWDRCLRPGIEWGDVCLVGSLVPWAAVGTSTATEWEKSALPFRPAEPA